MREFHYILKASSTEEIVRAQTELLASSACEGASVVFKRYFLSDPSIQSKELPVEQGAVAYIGQPPLDGSAVAVWLYLVKDAEVEYGPGFTVVKADGAEHLFTAGMVASGQDSEAQTRRILEDYEAELLSKGLSISDNCIRTWFYCKDIDNRYAGLVKARRENFETVGLTSRTHYIASTGIAGVSPVEDAFVQMDAWSVKGDFSQKYIYGSSHLNPTYEYGVTFERGVKVDFSGFSHILISGTASIDNKGNVLHIGDVVSQTLRMLENVEVLLSEAGAGWDSVNQILVYLRNKEDYLAVAPIFERKFPSVPYVITHAPVCRPDWLIEMECIATIPSLSCPRA